VAHLHAEGIPSGAIHRTGNTGIDSLKWMLSELRGDAKPGPRARDRVLVTLHRRENHDRNADTVCRALVQLAAARPDLRMTFPVHPNPRVSGPIRRRLGAHPAFALVPPMTYRDFIHAAANAALIISDSGGIQEEAPHLGTPLLVPRCNTERPESLATGFVQLVSIDEATIVASALAALGAPRAPPLPFDNEAPFGDGDASLRIVSILGAMVAERAYA
jgi:UDP-N-acetylglucosamine 2-epimerase (non-hydrolysing)